MREIAQSTRYEHTVATQAVQEVQARCRQQEDQYQPFFPAAFAVDPRAERLSFNFNNFILDSLELPCKLLGHNHRPKTIDSKHFESIDSVHQTIRQWRQDFSCFLDTLDESSLDSGSQSSTAGTAEAARKSIDKWQLFLNSGTPVDNDILNMPELQNVKDSSLEQVRVDILGNVMIWRAPSWSDASVHITHGFPRRLIREPHAGYTIENVTCTSRVTNQMIRSFALEDVFTLVRKVKVEKTGLSVAELTYARAKATMLRSVQAGRKNFRLMETMYR